MNLEPVLDVPVPNRLIWSDEFDGGLEKWTQPDFIGSDDRKGNDFLMLDGSINPEWNFSKLPARGAAFYDKYRDKCQFIRDGSLVMKGHAVRTPNIYRNNFTDSTGLVHPYGDWMLYTAWMEIKKTFYRGTILEVCVNLENMCMGGHRFSFWPMPANGQAYGPTVEFAEIDSPEVENPSRNENSDFGYRALMKIVGGDAGDTANGNIDLRDFGIDLRAKGDHTFTTVWNLDGSLDFLCDGILCNHDSRKVTMEARVIVSREMSSGVKVPKEKNIVEFNRLQGRIGLDPFGDDEPIDTLDGFLDYMAAQDATTVSGRQNIEQAQKVIKPWENYSTGPKMPKDDGLTAESVITYIDLIDEDEVLIRYVRAFEILEGESPKTDPDVDVGDPVVIDDLTIDEQIALLATQYERAEARITEQNNYIEELQASAIDARAIAQQKTDELNEYRERTNATISRLKEVEASLQSEIDELKKKPLPLPPAPVDVSPPVSQKSRDRLRRLLERARR